MQPWDYLVFVPVVGAAAYLWQRSRRKKGSCGACPSCPTQGCDTRKR